jgi:hypothetical protein
MVNSNASNEAAVNVNLRGVGEAGRLIAPRVVTLHTNEFKPIILKNASKGVLNITFGAASPNPPYSSSAGNATIQPGATAGIPVKFSPSAEGAAPAGSLAITVNPPSTGTITTTLRGKGS